MMNGDATAVGAERMETLAEAGSVLMHRKHVQACYLAPCISRPLPQHGTADVRATSLEDMLRGGVNADGPAFEYSLA